MSSHRTSSTSGKVTLKFISVILGYSFWAMINQSAPDVIDISIPITIENTPSNFLVDAPNAINVRLQASRALLRSITHENVALHIDGRQLHEGTNMLNVTHTTLLLPETVNVVHYTAAPLTITLKEKIAPITQMQDSSKGVLMPPVS